MKIVIAGGTGFLGRPLASRLALARHEIVVLTRQDIIGRPAEGLRYVPWRPDGAIPIASRAAGGGRSRVGDWTNEVADADAVINLAGAGLADERWTPDRELMLRRSRKESTESLVTAIRHANAKPAVFIQGSAVGYYGTTQDGVLTEAHGAGSDFLAALCVEWEAAALPVTAGGTRLVVARTGVVLSADGGALPKLAAPFRAFVGGPIGSGDQVLSWIHRDDWLSMITWAIETPAVAGPLNVTAPKPVTNREFAQALGRALHRPAWITTPGFVVRAAAGPVADVAVLAGQRVAPTKAIGLKFGFRYPDVDRALAAIFAGPTS
jgi:uncharacterized protein (TIGR01777 family)